MLRCSLPPAPPLCSIHVKREGGLAWPTPEEINADMLAFWNGQGGHIWVARQAHTDSTLDAGDGGLARLCRATRRRAGIGRRLRLRCPTLEFARAVGPTGRVAALDISGPMLAEGAARAKAAGIANVDWRQADPATAALDEYDVLTSAFGTMFFGDRVALSPTCAALPTPMRAWRSCAGGRWLKTRGWRCR